MEVTIAKRCADGTFVPGANCYLLRWQHPIEKKDLESYYIWLDNNVVNDSAQNASQEQMDRATKIIPYSGKGDGDSLDLTNLISEYLERDSLHIAIWAKYSGSEQGAVQHLYAHFGDDVPPAAISFGDSTSANAIWVTWIRPADQRDFYFPDIMNGPIAGYNVTIKAETPNATEDIRNVPLYISIAGSLINASDLKRFQLFNKDGRNIGLQTVLSNDPKILRFAIIDGNGLSDNMQENEWRMEITGLRPEHSYNVAIVAYDSAGNSSIEESRNIRTTDALPPQPVSQIFYDKDEKGFAVLDSNRLILSWLRSLDPPNNVEVLNYSIERRSGNAWEPVPPRISSVKTYAIEGGYIIDTLRWVFPGDTVRLRIRAIDNSTHYSSALDTTIIVSKEAGCPENFMPVKNDEDVFCMEKLQYAEGNRFKTNVLHIEAKEYCEKKGHHLCTEDEWNAACKGSYGIVEEPNEYGIFSPSEFLYMHCGVGTNDTLSAYYVDKRKKICASPDGIRDLPGQLQEWVTSADGEPLLKGTSYAVFEGTSRTELAQCRNRFTPTRIRPRYTTDPVYLYRSGSRIDTLLQKDENRTNLYAILQPSEFTDTLLFYSLKSSSGVLLGADYVDQKEFRRRGGETWLKVLWQGLAYEPKEKRQVLILGTESINASNFFLDPTVGFRCCI